MSRQDPGAASGRQKYPSRRVCECGHGDALHAINSKHQRAKCESATAAGACPCRMFVDAKAVSG
jgi:hypothetical protein